MTLDNLEPTDNFSQVETKIDAAIDVINVMAGGVGMEVLMKNGIGDFDFEFQENIAAGVRETGSSQQVRTRIIQIGDWDVQSSASVAVAHGLDGSTIRSVNVVIRSDSNAQMRLLDTWNSSISSPDGWFTSDSTNITLFRHASGSYCNSEFNQTSYNRGFITITYID